MPKSDYKKYGLCDKTCYFKRIGEDGGVVMTLYFENESCGYNICISGTDFAHNSRFNNRVNFRELEKMAHKDAVNVLEKYMENRKNAKK